MKQLNIYNLSYILRYSEETMANVRPGSPFSCLLYSHLNLPGPQTQGEL